MLSGLSYCAGRIGLEGIGDLAVASAGSSGHNT